MAYCRNIILTALGTWRTCTAFPILPLPDGTGHLKGAIVSEHDGVVKKSVSFELPISDLAVILRALFDPGTPSRACTAG